MIGWPKMIGCYVNQLLYVGVTVGAQLGRLGISGIKRFPMKAYINLKNSQKKS